MKQGINVITFIESIHGENDKITSVSFLSFIYVTNCNKIRFSQLLKANLSP
jgi:hypothetical protein